jgi:hypothetical protein
MPLRLICLSLLSFVFDLSNVIKRRQYFSEESSPARLKVDKVSSGLGK